MTVWKKFICQCISLYRLQKSIKFLLSDKFITSGAILTAATIISGILGYGYQIMLGSLMSPSNFAIFSAILSAYVFFASPFTVIHMLISRKVAFQLKEDKDTQYKYFEQSIFLVALMLLIPAAILLIFHDKFNKYLGITEWYVFPLIITFVWLVALQTVCNAFIQGMQLFGQMAKIIIFSVMLKLIVTAIFFHFLNFDILSGLLGLGISIILILTFTLKFISNIFCKSEISNLKNFTQYININSSIIINFIKTATPILIASMAFVGMTQLDMFFVNYYLPSDVAGNYAAASVFGKVILYLPGGLAMALYPMVASNHSNQKSSTSILKKALSATFISSLILCCIYLIFGKYILNFFYSEKYTYAYIILGWHSLAMIPMALILVMENFLIAKGNIIFSWIFLIIFPLQIIALNFFNNSPFMIIAVIGLSGLIVLMTGSIFIIYKYKLLKV